MARFANTPAGRAAEEAYSQKLQQSRGQTFPDPYSPESLQASYAKAMGINAPNMMQNTAGAMPRGLSPIQPPAQPMSRAAQMQQIRDQNARIQQESRARSQGIAAQNARIQQESRARNMQTGPSMGRPPASQINPQQPNIMGFPDRPMNAGGGLGGVPANRPSMSPAEEAFMRNAKSGMSSVNTTTQANMMGTARPSSGGFNPGNMMQGLQSIAARNNPQASSPAAPAFKKGGKVTAKAKAPVKKAAGGKVAAKAPVKKAMGGKVMAKGRKR